MNFKWLYIQAKNKRTKLFIQELEKELKSLKGKSGIVSKKQKFPLKVGKYNIWLNEENPINSLKTFLEIFKERDHTKLPNFPSKNDSIIIDLGANEGFYTLKIKEILPRSKIIAVEPNPTAFKILRKNIEANKLKNIEILKRAVTSKTGKIVYEIVKGRTTVSATKVYEKYRKKYELKRIFVDSIILEKLCKDFGINKIDLLKIDVEGSELDILKSSKNILSNVEKVVVEYHKAQKTEKPVIELMVKNNFRVAFIDRKKYYGDIYFEKNSL